MTLLPVRLDIAPEELLSSWVARLAVSNALPVRDMMGYLGFEKLVQSDYDLKGYPDFIDAIAMAGMNSSDAKRLHRALISNWGKRTGSASQCMRRWIVPAGHRHPKIRYCGYCLGEQAYYRKRWRLAWYAACHKHMSVLSNCCHACGAGQVLYRTSWANGLAYCTNCSSSLSVVRQAEFDDHEYWGTVATSLGKLRDCFPLQEARSWFDAVWTIGNWIEKVRRGGNEFDAFLSPALLALREIYPEAVAFHQARILWDKEPFKLKGLVNEFQFDFDRVTYKRCPRLLLPYRRPIGWRVPTEEAIRSVIDELIRDGEEVTFYKVADAACCSYETLRKHEPLNRLIMSFASPESLRRLRSIPT